MAFVVTALGVTSREKVSPSENLAIAGASTSRVPLIWRTEKGAGLEVLKLVTTAG